MNKSRISRQLADYLDYKQSLGFKLTNEATVLNRFAEYTITPWDTMALEVWWLFFYPLSYLTLTLQTE